MEAHLPEISDRYIAERSLGEQPVGSFYAAVDGERGGRVTVFRPRIDGGSARQFVRRAQLEVDRCAPLQSTPYCTLRDAGLSEDGAPYVVVDRPHGTPLSATLREAGRLSIDRALSVVIQVCDLVRRAHAVGIQAVPVSPDTIVVEELPGGRLRVSIVDLGLFRDAYAGAVQAPPRDGRLLAPQLQAGMTSDAADDVFAATALFHLLVFGVAPPAMGPYGPADGSGWAALPEEGRGLDRRLEACLHTVLLKGLAEERERRFGRIDELQRALTGLRQLMNLAAPAFELLAATRGRVGRGSGPFDVERQRPGIEKATQARNRIQEVVSGAHGRGAALSSNRPKLTVVDGDVGAIG